MIRRAVGVPVAEGAWAPAGDPLERMRGLFEQARDVWAGADGAREPLASLLARVEEARRGPWRALPAQEVAQGASGPIQALVEQIDRERSELGARGEPLAARAQVRSASSRSGAGRPGDLEAVVGRHVLAMVADEPLAAEARLAAVEAVVAAMEDPSRASLEAIFRLLVRG